MVSNGDRFGGLIVNARRVFVDDLGKRTDVIIETLKNLSGKNDPSKIKELLIYFHKLSGTASTLGLEQLSVIGRDSEKEINEVMESGGGLSQDLVESIRKTAESVKRELGIIRAATFHKDGYEDTSCGNYTNIQTGGRILLIDDDVTILKLLEDAFSAKGYEVYICDDPLSAVDIIAVSKPDAVLLDIMMPGSDGYETLSRIKANPEYSDICVIFLSAIDDVENKIKGMKAGVDDYITKPFNVREVVYRVEMVLKRANKFREKLLKDSLTGAYSRSYFNERIRDELERYKRYHTKFSVAFIDLDDFKAINDTYGHLAGDFVLQEFVAHVEQNLRESDCIFRYGGEEFIVLMPDTTEEQAYASMERIRERLCSRTITYCGSIFKITYSCGIKEVDEDDKTVGKLIDSADQAMYLAKNSGKNKVVRYKFLERGAENRKTLLLVDDENTILKLLSNRLTDAGYNVITAANGAKAIDIVGQIHVDAVILDLMLPDMDGMEVCRKIKENPLTSATRIIILSQRKGKSDIISGLKIGADDYVTKPFSMGELEARIMRVLSR